MKAMSNVDIYTICNELKEILKDARVDKAYQPTRDTVLIRFHAPGKGRVDVVFQAGLRVHTTQYPPENPQIPPSFPMILRKHLKGGNVTCVKQHNFDRILKIDIQKEHKYSLIIELFAKGNIILLDEEGTIIMPLKRKLWEDRNISSKEEYKYPPERGINPLEVTKEELKTLFAESDRDLIRTLASSGLGGLYAEEVMLRSGVEKDKPSEDITHEELDSINNAMREVFSPLKTAQFHPNFIMIKMLNLTKDQKNLKNEDLHIGKLLDERGLSMNKTRHDLEEEIIQLKEKVKDLEKKAKYDSQELFNQSPDGIWVLDKEFNVLEINKELSKILGIQNPLNDKCYNLLPNKRCNTDECPLKQVLTGNSCTEIETEDFLVTTIPLKDSQGNTTGIIEKFRGMAETEKELKKSERMYRLLADSCPDVIYRISIPEGHYEYMSPSSTVNCGRSPDEFYKKPLLIKEMLHPDCKDAFGEKFLEMIDLIRTLAGSGLGGLYAEEVVLRSGVEKGKPSSEITAEELNSIHTAMSEVFSPLKTNQFHPQIISDGKDDVLPLNLTKYEKYEKKTFETFNQAADEFYSSIVGEDIKQVHEDVW
ncbi:MAG: NFACT family protein, partial [Methanobacterium paludis]|nr:NFACT family protein [Methanobacterium paludis]